MGRKGTRQTASGFSTKGRKKAKDKDAGGNFIEKELPFCVQASEREQESECKEETQFKNR